jgi:hypothetical protein
VRRLPFFLILIAGCGGSTPADLAITNVTVLPMDGGPPLPGRTVTISAGRIERIVDGSADRSPSAEEEVDGTGRFLLPSLVDSHIHVCDSDDFATYLAYGIGLVRNMEGTPFHLEMRDALADGRLIGPRMVTTGPFTNAPRIADPESARREVETQAALGYDAIKIHGPMDIATLVALGEAARAAGLPVIGHIPRDQDFVDVAETGVMSEIAHAEEYLYTLYGLRPNVDPAETRAEAVALTVAGGLAVTPTLTTYRSILRQVADVEAAIAALPTRALSPFAIRGFAPERNRYARRFERADSVWLAENLETQIALVGDLARAGVTLLTGTDANNPASGPGYSLYEELDLLRAAGLSELEVLRAATVAGWQTLTGDSAAGIVVEGSPAELLLVDGDPLADIRNIRRMAGIVRAGRWIAGDALQASLDSIYALRQAEQPFVERLWDNTLVDAVTSLEEARAAGNAPMIRTATWRCESALAVREGVPEVALDALDRALAAAPGDSLTLDYRAIVERLVAEQAGPPESR